jgi:hypothetical protein
VYDKTKAQISMWHVMVSSKDTGLHTGRMLEVSSEDSGESYSGGEVLRTHCNHQLTTSVF